MSWSWREVGNDMVDPLFRAPMKDLENELARIGKVLDAQKRVATTDATVTTIQTVVCPVDTTTLVSGFVVARRTGGSAGSANDGAGYRVEFVAKNTSGTAALIGAGTVTTLGESQAGWDVTLSASGGTILVQVTGAANNAIQWRWTGRSFSVKE